MNGNDAEISFYNGATTIELTINPQFFIEERIQGDPDISGDIVVWGTQIITVGAGGTGLRTPTIYLYDGTPTQIIGFGTEPHISGENVVWNEFGTISFYNSNNTVQLNEGDNPQISGNNVVWQGYDDNDVEIFFYDGISTVQLTDNGTDDYLPQISGDKIVWENYDGNDSEIYLTVLENDDLLEQGLIELYRFRNINYETGGYLFVGEEEKDVILANPDFNQTFSLEGVAEDGALNPAFVASVTPNNDLLAFYRLRSLDTTGTYLFVGTEEYNSIFAENSLQRNKWIAEGLDAEGMDIPEFYLYGVGAGQGIEFHRFQDINNHSYLFAGPLETEAIYNDPLLLANFVDEGPAFKSLI